MTPVPIPAALPDGMRRILVVEAGPIDPGSNAGDRACADLLDGLVAIGAEVRFHALGTRGSSDGRLISAMLDRNPEIAISHNDGDLKTVLDAEPYDAVIASRPGTALVCGPAFDARPEIVRIFWGHDIHARRLAAQRSVRGNVTDRRSALVAMAETRNWEAFDLSVYPAAGESDVVNEVAPGKGVASPYYRLADADLPVDVPARTGRHGILMVGSSFHAPNADAVEWAIAEILPLIRADQPDAVLTIAGDWSLAERQSLARPGVRFTGLVTEVALRALHDEHVCLLAPLRFGGGTKRKIVAAMGLGLPVVTTDEGQRGLLVRDGQGETDGVGLGNDPGSLAAAVSKLHTDLDLWATMSAVAHGSVRNVYACAAYDDHLRRVLTDGVTRRNNRLLLSGQTGADPIASPSRPGA